MKKSKMTVLAAIFAASMMTVCNAQEQGTETATEEAAKTEAANSQVASAEEMAQPVDIVDEDMVAVYGSSIKDGTYSIEVDSSSSMFKIIDCQLTVEQGEMKAAITLNGDGYLKLYMGTGLEAVEAAEDDDITFTLNDEGKQVYEVPVEALDMGIDCAAFSKKKEKWYDRVLVFRADSLPQDAFAEGTITQLSDLDLEDGTYQIGVTLEGGSGKTSVASPAKLVVEGDQATATIVWSSHFYDYMIVNGERIEPVTMEENSVFEIAVAGFDWKMPVTADTIAMSTPHEIDYTLYFDSATIEKAEE
ncbi:MAG: hypothetical protein Q4C50_02430 [Eubacteriales bacterium]|nr:hypothetical protein [Eubacteriales bacterium]